jgi:hypothetical protein
MSDQELETMLEEFKKQPGESNRKWEARMRRIKAEGRWSAAEFWERVKPIVAARLRGKLTSALERLARGAK